MDQIFNKNLQNKIKKRKREKERNTGLELEFNNIFKMLETPTFTL